MVPRLLWKSLAARRARVALALLAVALGSGMTIALMSLALQVGDDVARALRAAGPNFVIQARDAGWSPDLGGERVAAARVTSWVSEGAVAALKQSFWKNNILEADPELDVPARIVLLGGDSTAAGGRTPVDGGVPARVVGSWFQHAAPSADGAWNTGLASLHPTWKVEGRWPAEDGDQIVLGRDLARRLGAGVGASLLAELPTGGAGFRVAGIVTAGGDADGWAFAPLQRLQRLTGREGQVSRVELSALLKAGRERQAPDPARDPQGYEKYRCTAYPSVVAADLRELLPDAEVVPAAERIAGEAHVVTRLTLLMLLLALAGLAAATLGMLSTMTATVVERSTELALMRAIGASSRQLAGLLLGETLLVAIAGGALGWWLGSAGAALIRGAGASGSPTYQPLLLPVALAAALIVGLAGTLGPLRLALRVDPARVLRG